MNRLHGRRVVLAAALLAPIALLAVACTSGSHGASVARLSAAATTASTASSSAAASDLATEALAFARCLRANGLPNWPDPLSNGAFDKSKLQATGYTTTQVRAVEDGPCKSLLPTTAPSTPNTQTITTQQQQDYVSAVACMRSHGYLELSRSHVLRRPRHFDSSAGRRHQLDAVHAGPAHLPAAHPRGPAVQQVRRMTHIRVLAARRTRPAASSVQWWFVG